MFKLSKKTEYSILSLRYIARQKNKSAAVKEMADALKIPRPLLAKLFQALVRKKIVASSQGARGGYTLQMDLNELSLMDLVEMIEGPLSLTACQKANYVCAHRAGCRLKKSIAPVEEQVRIILQTVKLADL